MSPEEKNTRTLRLVFAAVAFMIALSFASVPLYKKLCQVTGWGGTTQIVETNPYQDENHSREFVVRFDSNVHQSLDWTFKPETRAVRVKMGEDGVVHYVAKNNSQTKQTGVAVYNVTPLEAGQYFYKTQCFCFGEMVLGPGEDADMPVVFFVDPEIAKDRNLRDIKTITLSYTFYKQDSDALEKAIENFTDTPDNL